MNRRNALGIVAGGMLAAWGLFLALGLAFFRPALAQSLPRLDVTSPETVVCFVLAGAGLLAGSGTVARRRWQAVCAAAVLAIATVAVARFFVADIAADAAARMTPATAAALSAGSAILAIGPRVRGLAAAYAMQLLLLALLVLALLANIGHVLNWAVDFSLFDMGFRRHALGWATAVGLVPLLLGTFAASQRMDWFHRLYADRPDRQIFALSATMLLVVAVVAGLAGAGVFARETLIGFKETLRSALSANSQLVVDAIRDAQKDVEHLSRNSNLETLLRAAPARPNAAAIQAELERVVAAEGADGPAAIWVGDATGHEIAAAGRRSAHGDNRIRLATPRPAWLFWLDGYRVEVHYGVDTGDGRQAWVAAEFRLDDISRHLNYTGALGSSGEVVICAAGREALDCYPSRLTPQVFHVASSVRGQLRPVARALAGEENVLVLSDYRNKPVIAAFKPLADTGLGMAQKIDTDEFYAAIRQQFWLSTLGACLLVIGAAAILYRRIHPTVRALAQMSRLYAVLSKSNQAIVRLRDLTQLLEEICRIAVEEGTFVMAWAAHVDGERVVPVARWGHEDGYLEQARIIVHDRQLGSGPTGLAIREGRHFVCDNIATDARMEPWRALALARGYRASAAFPIRQDGVVVGSINLYAPQAGFFTPAVVDLLDDLTEDIDFALDAHAESQRRRQAEEDLRHLNERLESRVAERTRQLESANKELEAFSYSVSHDLRAPLRAVDGFSQVLLKRYADKLDATGRDYLGRVRRASQRMGELIDDLLQLSRMTRGTLRHQDVDLSAVAQGLVEELRRAAPEREVAVCIQDGMRAYGDLGLLRVVLDNLLGNAWKFTRRTAAARIDFDCRQGDDELVYCVRDNGAGFDNAYGKKLFQVFQRLHTEDEFEGTGIGLATVQRVVARHGGRVWAEGAVQVGAAFYFTLPPRAMPPPAND